MSRLRKSDIRELSDKLPIDLDKKDEVIRENHAIRINGRLSFFMDDMQWVPAIPLLLEQPDLLPQLTVDMGAIKHIVNGADIMRPGITKVPEVPKDSFVAIIDETHGKPIAVGQLLVDGSAIKLAQSGKVVRNVHYVGDELWESR